jgi:DNA-binding FadR family transcriptional regulator
VIQMPSDSKPLSEALQKPILRQKLSDQVFDRLWHMVQSGELAAGDTMPSERALMERFAVGRPAVREALQMMANKGLISISHGERSRVNKLTADIAFDQVDDIAKLLLSTEPANLDHLKHLRRIIESSSVQITAARCTPEQIATLRALIADQRSKLGQDRAFIAADIAFHVAISEMTDNPLVQAVTQAMLSWLFQYYKPLLLWSGRENTTLLEHERLVDCLEAHDAAGALKMMTDHLERADPLYNAT